MKFIEIKINENKILMNNKIILDERQIFPKGSQILGIIGPNGSGKTTLCALIAYVFQSIYTRSKHEFDVKVTFKHNEEIKTIECENSKIKLSINGEAYYRFELGSKFNTQQKDLHHEKLIFFWDGKIILSTFETRGEYPNQKPYNFCGYDPLLKYDAAQLYGKNMYGYPSITKGIIRFLESSIKQNIAREFLREMGFTLPGTVDIKIVENVANLHKWSQFESNATESDEENLYRKIIQDHRIMLTAEKQTLNAETAMAICEDYSEYIGKYIFLNGFRLEKDTVDLGFDDLSSGEKFLILRYLSILSGVEKNSIIILEEPENHLNPKWRELIIPALHKIANAYNSVIIFTTHDYRIIRYLHNDCVLKINKGKIRKVDMPTLLCDEFDFESIGEKTVPFVYEDLEREYSSMNRLEKAKLLNSMCNVEEKILLRKKYLEDNA